MSFLLFVRNNRLNPSRRTFLSDSGLLLSASAVALLAGCETLAAGQKKSGGSGANDITILSTALGAKRWRPINSAPTAACLNPA